MKIYVSNGRPLARLEALKEAARPITIVRFPFLHPYQENHFPPLSYLYPEKSLRQTLHE